MAVCQHASSWLTSKVSVLHKKWDGENENEIIRNDVKPAQIYVYGWPRIKYKIMEWSWFKVPIKVRQINDDLFSETVQIKAKQQKCDRKWCEDEWLWKLLWDKIMMPSLQGQLYLGSVQT